MAASIRSFVLISSTKLLSKPVVYRSFCCRASCSSIPKDTGNQTQSITSQPENGHRSVDGSTEEMAKLFRDPQVPAPTAVDYSKLQLYQDNMMVDTYALIKTFKDQGFSEEQAECITYTFTKILNEALRKQSQICVEKAALDIAREQIMAHIAALRKDMVILEKSELLDIRNEIEKLKLLLGQTKAQSKEDVRKVQNQMTLDINIERSRAKDDITTMEKSLANLQTKLASDLGNLETTFERYKNDIYKFFAGSLISGVTLTFTVYRLFKIWE